MKTTNKITLRYSLMFFMIIALALIGVAGNHLRLPLFFGVDFIFGSIAAFVALRLLGMSAGIFVALIAGAYTYVLWWHPYAMIIFTLEVLVVGVLLRRKISSLVLADILYWVFLGMPLIWLFYSGMLGMQDTQSIIILLKQPVNGIANAIIATYLLFLIPKRFFISELATNKSQIHFKELLFTTLLAISFFFTLMLIIYQGHEDKTRYEESLNNEMQLYADFIEHQLVNSKGSINTHALENDYHLYKYKRDLIVISIKTGDILLSSMPSDITQAFLKKGNKKIISDGLNLWMPERKGQPFMLWWKQAYYFIQKPLGTSTQTNLLLLQHSQPIIDKLQTDSTRAFILLFGLIVASGAIAYFFSNMLTGTILKLTESTRNIAEKLQTGTRIDWPHSAISELNQLSRQAQLMSDSISDTFRDVNKRSTTIIEASVDAIITINDKGNIESFNAAAERLFGYTRNEVMGKNVSCLMPEPYQSQHDQYIHNFTNKTRQPFSGVRRELSGMNKDGTVFPIELSLTTIRLQDQIIYTGIISDISERKANEKLKQEFISTVSHELRTPLTSIQGAIKLIQARKTAASAEEVQTMLDLAERNVNRLAELINDLLDFEKLDADGIEYHFESIDVNNLLTTIIENDSPMANQASVKLIHDAECHAQIDVDSTRLNQVISNFISNAIKFSPAGASIHIGCNRENDQVRIYVLDHGEGIPDKFKERIFQRFSQADSSDTKRIQRGTGLGLAISKRITEDMGGNIGFESQEGNGSTFYVSFPHQTSNKT